MKYFLLPIIATLLTLPSQPVAPKHLTPRGPDDPTSIWDSINMPHIEVRTASLPLELAHVNWEDTSLLKQLSDGRQAGIEDALLEFYIGYCGYDSSLRGLYPVKSAYIGSLEIQTSSRYTLYWILFREVLGRVNSSVLFFDETQKDFLPYHYGLNVFALYDERDRKLHPSNLKKVFSIDTPEITLTDVDGDAYPDFTFTRLYHNGTANAIERVTVEITDGKADTLSVEREWLGE